MGILRITNRMLKEHPTGWRHCLLRLEPLVLVGGPGDERTGTASLYDRPLEVFGDPPESGSYNAHGQYLTAFEDEQGLTMRAPRAGSRPGRVGCSRGRRRPLPWLPRDEPVAEEALGTTRS